MTSVVCWHNKKESGLWVVADSRLSDPGRQIRLTDYFSKIHEIPLRFKYSQFPLRTYLGSIGLAFAGSTLIAQTVKDTLITLLGSLQTLEEIPSEVLIQKYLANDPFPLPDITTYPSLLEIANLTCDIISQALMNYESHTQGEILLFGHCKKNNELKAFSLRFYKKSIEDQKCLKPVDIDLSEPYIFGDRVDIVKNNIKNYEDDSRAPLKGLAKTMKDAGFAGSVGGHLQLAISNEILFKIHGIANSARDFIYAGYKLIDGDTMQFKMLGSFLIAPDTMAEHQL
ncbi:hypothetical protein [Acinetobacter lwoffii]|uniref:hypothetical protein n=1 Tax=Acinetobacter lwoffii TaxID=28090 RepID=UPI002DB89B7C|nr:hypothetical protein [Acinetobacter lwoffii]MEB6679324.1 hypothetical protein [Acinetobacter lwoffii]